MRACERFRQAEGGAALVRERPNGNRYGEPNRRPDGVSRRAVRHCPGAAPCAAPCAVPCVVSCSAPCAVPCVVPCVVPCSAPCVVLCGCLVRRTAGLLEARASAADGNPNCINSRKGPAGRLSPFLQPSKSPSKHESPSFFIFNKRKRPPRAAETVFREGCASSVTR